MDKETLDMFIRLVVLLRANGLNIAADKVEIELADAVKQRGLDGPSFDLGAK